MVTNIDSNSPICAFLGVNNLVDAAASFQKKEYAESMTNLAKAALKWTCMGAVCVGFRLMTGENPIYLNDVHERAVHGLNEEGSQEISSDAKLLLDKYFQEQSNFKRWPQSGKDYVKQCLEANTAEASFGTRYFLEKSIELNDSSLLKEVIKSCSKAATTTKSCLAAQEVFNENTENVTGVQRKVLSACRKSDNAFCRKVREDHVNKAVKENDWDSLLKNCVKLKVNSESCKNGLDVLEQTLAVPSKETWTMANKIDAQCRSSHLPICLKSREILFDNILEYGTWEQIVKFVGSHCRKTDPKCENLVDGASSAFIEEMIKGQKFPNDHYSIYRELKFMNAADHQSSKISMALVLAGACVNNPTPTSKSNVQKLVTYLERYKNSIGGYSRYFSSYYEDGLIELLETKIKALKEKVEQMPIMENESTHSYSEKASSSSKPRRSIVYKFDCNRMDWVEKNLIKYAGRKGSLQLSHLFDRNGNEVKEEDVDWESCGL